MCRAAEAREFHTVLLEAPEKRSLPALLAAPLRVALLKMDRKVAAGDLAKRGLRALGGNYSTLSQTMEILISNGAVLCRTEIDGPQKWT